MDSARRMLITGAGQRVGAALARHFAAQGWQLVLHYHRSRDAAETLADALRRAHGVTVDCHGADLAGNADEFWNGLLPCHAILHNAAMFTRDRLQTMQTATAQQQLQVNFIAPLLLSQGFMAQLPEDAVGNILLLGDGTFGWSISPEFFSYAASKQALAGCLDLLAAACAPRARVNLIALGPSLPGATDSEAMFARLAQRAPLQRTSTPEEVMAAADYALNAPGMTGQTLYLSGGGQLRSWRPVAELST